jgi:predicted TIM-barrel fold metal-dependent hydrolase
MSDQNSSSRLVVVSADSHVGLPAPHYRQYFDPGYRDQLDSYMSDTKMYHSLLHKMGYPASADVLDVIDKRSAMLTGGVAGYFDPKRRLQEDDDDGVVAEILHPGGPISNAPLFDNSTSPSSPELRAAGVRAYNRFLAEFCSYAPDRLFGVAPVYPWPDMEAAADTVRWAKEAGMVAVWAPRMAGADNDLPPFYDKRWDPLWDALSETGLLMHIHAGWGYEQGAVMALVRDAMARAEAESGSVAEAVSQFFEDVFQERRPLWQLMWGGVFDRFPNLKVAFIEIRADWLPATLELLDRYNDRSETKLAMRPSEYWQQNCVATATFMRPSDLRARSALGLDKILFGTDYPHIESTWPNTVDFLRVVLDDVPEADARAILGGNAISLYGLDRVALEAIAARIGPRPEDVYGQRDLVDERLITHWNKVNGLGKSPNIGEQRLSQVLDLDLPQASLARA